MGHQDRWGGSGVRPSPGSCQHHHVCWRESSVCQHIGRQESSSVGVVSADYSLKSSCAAQYDCTVLCPSVPFLWKSRGMSSSFAEMPSQAQRLNDWVLGVEKSRSVWFYKMHFWPEFKNSYSKYNNFTQRSDGMKWWHFRPRDQRWTTHNVLQKHFSGHYLSSLKKGRCDLISHLVRYRVGNNNLVAHRETLLSEKAVWERERERERDSVKIVLSEDAMFDTHGFYSFWWISPKSSLHRLII